MPTAADRTLGELARRLDEVAQRFEALANRLDTTYVRREALSDYKALAEAELERLRDLHKAQLDRENELKRRISSLEEGRQWLTRLVAGSVAGAALSLILTVGPKLGG